MLQPSYKKLNAGFTLIELVIVIVILGIIAVSALPKFLNISKDTKSAVLNKLAGDMTSLNEQVHAKAIILGKDKISGNAYFDTNLGEVNVFNGYLETIGEGGSQIGIFEMVGVSNINDFTLSSEAQYCAYRRGGFGDLGTAGSANLGNSCFIEYKEACSLNVKYIITVVDTGC
jgi:MSHA pilin protein MshA